MTSLIAVSSRSAAAAALFLSVGAANAQFQVDVVMSGLNAPRDVAVAPNGDIYVVEAGTSIPTAGLTAIPTDTGPAYFGSTGSVSLFSGGVQTRPVNGLPMLYNPANGGEVVGAHGIVITGTGAMYISTGLGATAAARDAGPAGAQGLGRLLSLSFTQPDLADYVFVGSATAENPTPSSNPFHLAQNGSGFVVADAADNSVLSVDSAGTITRLGTLDNISNPQAPGGFSQFVPTGVAVDSNSGDVFVGGLTGFPFTPGAASVYRLNNGTATQFATGFTNIIDIERGADGTLFVLEYDSDGLLGGENHGGLWAVSADGTSRELLQLSMDLINPTGLTEGPDGTLFITHNGGSDGTGQLLAVVIPEPSALLLGIGAAGTLLTRRRRAAV